MLASTTPPAEAQLTLCQSAADKSCIGNLGKGPPCITVMASQAAGLHLCITVSLGHSAVAGLQSLLARTWPQRTSSSARARSSVSRTSLRCLWNLSRQMQCWCGTAVPWGGMGSWSLLQSLHGPALLLMPCLCCAGCPVSGILRQGAQGCGRCGGDRAAACEVGPPLAWGSLSLCPALPCALCTAPAGL